MPRVHRSSRSDRRAPPWTAPARPSRRRAARRSRHASGRQSPLCARRHPAAAPGRRWRSRCPPRPAGEPRPAVAVPLGQHHVPARREGERKPLYSLEIAARPGGHDQRGHATPRRGATVESRLDRSALDCERHGCDADLRDPVSRADLALRADAARTPADCRRDHSRPGHIVENRPPAIPVCAP
jgi:hypothetical protein